MTFRTVLIFFTAVAVLSISASFIRAQNYEAAPGIAAMEDRLRDDFLRFNATVNTEVDDDVLELGRLVAMGGSEAGDSGMACITCHGADGTGDGSGAFPRLAGQAGWYTYKQLKDYASGDRQNRVMSGIAKKLTDEEMEAVAAYYATISAPYTPPLGDVDGMTLQWGGQLGAVGSAERGVPACVNCHGPSGLGNPPSVPYLAGQYASYLAHQLEMWKQGKRDNDIDNVMSAIARKMTQKDIDAVSEYYNRVRPPLPIPPGAGPLPEPAAASTQ
ncbi:cytochrome c553 [Hoeflea halophila]|uniref:Cytochrome c553 n=1 Tax=Hoeflea halophila TaxID=714899 RepID=A0A286IAK3_9HYPH|nr:c-type cytochrome [Hoeflea halophila]SOE17148.1 cytochrome c553 [Hoeflea halophila]